MAAQWKQYVLLFVSLILAWGCATDKKDAFGYRLGDMVKSKEARDAEDGRKLHFEKFPSSIASEYMRRTDENNRLDILMEILKDRTKHPSQTPPPDMLLIHLRIGDVIDKTPYMVKDFLSRYVVHSTGYNYVKPLSYYESILEKIKDKDIKSITLIGGFHADVKSSKKSLLYVQKIKEFFEEHHYTTFERINGDPDEDFIFMCNAEFFTPSGGGYSYLIQEVLRIKGKQSIVGN